MGRNKITEYYFKLEGIMNVKDSSQTIEILNTIVKDINGLKTGVDVTHTETAMILANGDVMKYEVAGGEDHE